MTDTPLDIRRLQGQIIRQKSLEQRLSMVFEMMEGGKQLVFNRLQKQHPDWSEGEVKTAVFERIYRTDFSKDEMERIKAILIAFHQRSVESA